MKNAAIATLFALVCASSVSAQLEEDRVPRERTVPVREQVKQDLEGTPRRLGPVRVFPEFRLGNIGYNSNVGGTEEDPIGDYTASVSAGARYLVPFGRKVFVRGELMPSYTYYRELEDRRTTGGNYSASLLGLFNEMQVELSAHRSDIVRSVSTETEMPARTVQDGFTAGLEIDVLPRISLFGGFVQREYGYELDGSPDVEPTPLDALERTDDALRAGLRYHVTSFFNVAAGVEHTNSEFARGDSLRDHETNAVILSLYYDRPRMFANASVGHRKGEASAAGSLYPSYSDVTGSYYVSYRLGAPIEAEVFGTRAVVNSLFVDNAFFLETRNGVGLVWHAGERFSFRNSVEMGSNEYPREVVFGNYERLKRADDVMTYGAGVSFRIWRDVGLAINASRSEYESNIPGFDRSVLRVGAGVTIH